MLLPRTIIHKNGKIGPTYGNVYCFYCNWDNPWNKAENITLYDWSAKMDTISVQKHVSGNMDPTYILDTTYRIELFEQFEECREVTRSNGTPYTEE